MTYQDNKTWEKHSGEEFPILSKGKGKSVTKNRDISKCKGKRRTSCGTSKYQ